MATEPAPAHAGLDTIAGLAEPHRRALYDYVSKQRTSVGREQAAAAVGIRRGVAAHHLDRLADDGLLETDYQQLSERRGPGSGRPAKVYRRAPTEIEVSLPPRRYKMAGRLMAEAVEGARTNHVPIDDAIAESARREGRRLGDSARQRLGGHWDGPPAAERWSRSSDAAASNPRRSTPGSRCCTTVPSTYWPSSTPSSSAA